jgi:hypothetical protein
MTLSTFSAVNSSPVVYFIGRHIGNFIGYSNDVWVYFAEDWEAYNKV